MFSTVLIDDEWNALQMLEIELKQAFPDVKILDKFQNPEIALEFLLKTKPNLLFIDIEMPQMSGFDLLSKVDLPETQIIFTTAYSQYAIEAIKANAIDYLLKPLDTEELTNAVKKAVENLKNTKNTKLDSILEKLDASHSNLIKIPTSSGYAFLKKQDIIYCKSDSNYTHIFTTEKTFLVSKTLKTIQELLPDDEFMRVHNSFLVNVSHIKEYSRTDGGFVVMSNNSQIRVSNSRKDLFSQ